MAYRYEKETDGELAIIIDGFEDGIAASPHEGIANIQGGNIATEQGEVMCSFTRIQQSQSGTGGTLTRVNTNTVSISGITLLPGTWITITNAGTTGLSGDYYYLSSGKLSATFSQDTTTIVTGINAGSATFTVYSMTSPVMSASEIYKDSTNAQQYRYYILDDSGHIWVHDTKTLSGVDTPLWFLPNKATLSAGTKSGLAVLNGWLSMTIDGSLFWKSTSKLGEAMYNTSQPQRMSPGFHPALVGHQGKLYLGDKTYIASVFPNTSLLSGYNNVQSYGSFTAVGTTCTITNLISGSYPVSFNSSNAILRIPVTFFTSGTIPSALTADALSPLGNVAFSQIYYIEMTSSATFSVYAAITGGAALNMQIGATGTLYFNTFFPISTSGLQTITVTPQRLNLPFFENIQCMAELGNQVIIGGVTNTLYPWDQVSALPSDLIILPESDTKQLLTVNNVVYAFTGNKGNIYTTNGSSVEATLSVADYTAGIPGTPSTYIEPYFVWGATMYLRGRVYFSILDQTATKAGNCGGIWSFIPDVEKKATRVENQNSYGTYSGVATVLIKNEQQNDIGPLYWSAWYSSITSPTYGIDYTGTIPQTCVVETDLIPTGTMLQKTTFKQIEYKLASPLASGETLTVKYRQNGTDAWVSSKPFNTEPATGLSGVSPVNFQKGQWLQLQITLNPLASTSSSFVRLKEIRIR